MTVRTNRLGEVRESNNCGPMEIIEYNSCKNIKVKFKTGTIIQTQYEPFKDGRIKDPLHPTVYNVGYFGIEKNKNTCTKRSKAYKVWNSMLSRCYAPYILNKTPTYRDVIVCKSWLNFQNFAEWMESNYYEIQDDTVELDKDLMRPGNKIYHPKLCSFVPQSINTLLNKNLKHKKSNLPIGVCVDGNKYSVNMKINGKQKYIGRFNTPNAAFFAYKTEKEKQIKISANRYKDVLHPRVYRYLMLYEVTIN